MTDYSKPIRWECHCGHRSSKSEQRRWWCALCRDLTTIPVFPIIPEGERPEAEEPDGETVCSVEYEGGFVLIASQVGMWSEGRWVTLCAACSLFDKKCYATLRHGCLTEPQAVLYVADGVLP